jgi:outer membrane protein OmpA-like peptidoglycan-associated protein
VAGHADLLVEVRGPDGALARDAHVRLGGDDHPAPEGWALLPGLGIGPVKLAIEAPGFTGATEDLVLVEGAQERRLRLAWEPRPVDVSVVDASGAPVDAEVRLAGPGDVRPGATGADGKVSARVLPGDWNVLVSAPALGARSVAALVSPGTSPVEVNVTLEAVHVEVTTGAVNLDQQIHFGFDDAAIAADSFPVLEEVAAALVLHPEITRVEIEGHTDDRGVPAYNLDLSQRRADAVRAWLVEHGVAPERLVAKGYGATRPVAPNDTDAGRARNRRVQITVVARE